VSVRVDLETLQQLDELAAEMDRSRASLLARIVREYVEEEYPTLLALRESDEDIKAGRWVSQEEAKAWLKDMREGRERKPRYGQ
jgi:predicted transcriptional regulator